MDLRSSVVRTRALRLMPLLALGLLGCPKQELAPLGPCTVSAVSERVDQSGVSDVDLLFVVDNSGSMASEQVKLAAQLPRLVQVLTSGDRYAGVPEDEIPPGIPETERYFTAVKTLHLGVVSTNMGGIVEPQTQQASIQSCRGFGDDGKLLSSTEVAADGVYAMRGELAGYEEGEEVLAPNPDCAGLDLPKYQSYVAADMDDPDAVALAFSCVSTLGVRGCPFEQQLEAMWKALAPTEGLGDDSLYSFVDDSSGHGDGYNRDFLRENAILAVIIVSDEEDCSITDQGKNEGLYEQGRAADERWNALLNLRCGTYAEDTNLIHPTQRYVDGLRSLKPDNPDRIIYAAIVGVPEDAVAEGLSYQEMLDLPEMQFAEAINPATGMGSGLPRTSCTTMTNGRLDEAYPPRRMVEVAQGLGAENSVVFSICAPDYSPALDSLIQNIASKLKGNCLPRRLNPDASGQVRCEVFELLAPGDVEDGCTADRGHLEGEPVRRIVREDRENVERFACRMNQIAIETAADGTKSVPSGARGWYYDDFSESLTEDCQEGQYQRISFQFSDGSDLPGGAGATFECFQPVARVDEDAEGFDAVNSSCADTAECDAKEGEPADYNLFCLDTSNTCQIECENNPQCPPGWVCDYGGDGMLTDGPRYCQLPTCPQDNSSGGGDEATGGGGGGSTDDEDTGGGSTDEEDPAADEEA